MHAMSETEARYAPGRVRDAILQVLSLSSKPLSIQQIQERVSRVIGPTPTSSVRSYLRLNTPKSFVRQDWGVYSVRRGAALGVQRSLLSKETWQPPLRIGHVQLIHA